MDADIIIKNAKVYSVELDGTETRVSALAIKDGVFAVVGDEGEMSGWTGADTTVIDAGGHGVLPGFCDAHLHISFSAGLMYGCGLFHIRPANINDNDRDALLRGYKAELAAYIAGHPDQKIVRGIGWNMSYFADRPPGRADLDEICPDKPLVLESYCQHHLWVNSKAIEAAGLTAETPTPRCGVVLREENGYPIGIFSEFSAMRLIREGIVDYDYSPEEYMEIILAFQREYAGPLGLTLAFDALCTENARIAFKKLAEKGALTMRIRAQFDADSSLSASQFETFIKRKEEFRVGDVFDIKTIKFFMEGSHTNMYMGEPYEERCLREMGLPDGYVAEPYWSKEELADYYSLLMEHGFQLHTHAMGDGSVRHTIDGYEEAYRRTGKDTRNVIAHLMYVKPEDIRRMGRLGTIACMQPIWMSNRPGAYYGFVYLFGEKRQAEFYPYRSLLDAGCHVSAGTDFPITPPPDPFLEIETAITRTIPRVTLGYEEFCNHPLGPQDNPYRECVSLKEILRDLTMGGAYQNFLEDVTGSIAVGKSAELVVLDKDIESMAHDRIHETSVLTTIFKGKIVYQKKE